MKAYCGRSYIFLFLYHLSHSTTFYTFDVFIETSGHFPLIAFMFVLTQVLDGAEVYGIICTLPAVESYSINGTAEFLSVNEYLNILGFCFFK